MRFASKLILAAVAAITCLWASPGAQAQNVANGRSLFINFCQTCHGNPPQGGPETAGNNPGLIRTAINGKVPDMRSLSFLTDANLADIAAWIASLSAPAGPPTPAADYTDLWYNANESGWGFNIIQHGPPSNLIFGVMYTYDANHHPVWFVLPGGAWTTSTLFIGNWYRVTGPAFNGPFDSSKVHVGDPVGNAQLNFTDANHGTLIFSVNGTQVVKTIERQPF
jgi:cytochrome c553